MLQVSLHVYTTPTAECCVKKEREDTGVERSIGPTFEHGATYEIGS